MVKHLSIIIAAALALGAVACNKQAPESGVPASAHVWNVRVNAVKGAATKALTYDEGANKILTSFKTTDKVYVYNKTKGALDEGVMSPESDGASTVLHGSLQGDYSVGDVLDLRYSPYFAFDGGVFDYEEQTGSFETLRDFGIATVRVTAVDNALGTLALEDASFSNPFSIFRFSFVDSYTHNPIPIDMLYIKAAFGKLVFMDNPDGTRKYYGPMDMNSGTFPWERPLMDTTDPVWFALSYEAPETNAEYDGLLFDIEDNVNKIVYDMFKPGDGKLANGNYYATTIEMMALPKPDVTLTASGQSVQPTRICAQFERENYYTYINPGDDITIGGESGDQCRFQWNTSGDKTVRFKGTASGGPQFFVCSIVPLLEHLGFGVLTIDLDGNTQIIGEAADKPAINIDFGYKELIIQGDGTLTITASNTVGTKGIALADASGSPREGVPNVHAAAGCTLEISDGTDNGNGTSTWIYTVRPEGSAPSGSIHDYEFDNNGWED